MRLYYFFGTLMGPFAKIGFYLFSRATGTKRVRVLVKNEHDEALFLKTWLGGDKWGLPGGGVERGESLEHAAARELFEETGIEVAITDLALLFTLEHMGHEEIVYMAEAQKSSLPPILPDRFEVKEAAWLAARDVRHPDSLTGRILQTVALKG